MKYIQCQQNEAVVHITDSSDYCLSCHNNRIHMKFMRFSSE